MKEIKKTRQVILLFVLDLEVIFFHVPKHNHSIITVNLLAMEVFSALGQEIGARSSLSRWVKLDLARENESFCIPSSFSN